MTSNSHSQKYELRVRGHLAPRRLCCFGALAISHDPDGNTTIVGEFQDQAALHGLLGRLRDLGVALVSVNPVTAPDTD